MIAGLIALGCSTAEETSETPLSSEQDEGVGDAVPIPAPTSSSAPASTSTSTSTTTTTAAPTTSPGVKAWADDLTAQVEAWHSEVVETTDGLIQASATMVGVLDSGMTQDRIDHATGLLDRLTSWSDPSDEGGERTLAYRLGSLGYDRDMVAPLVRPDAWHLIDAIDDLLDDGDRRMKRSLCEWEKVYLWWEEQGYVPTDPLRHRTVCGAA